MDNQVEELIFLNEKAALQVQYVAHAGTDMTPVNAARISRAKEGHEDDPVTDKDLKLMKFLAKNEHMTPFEHQFLSVIVYCPLYIRSQIHRHRTFSFNEVSRRYTSDNIEVYIPDTFFHQSLKNKQGGSVPLGDIATILCREKLMIANTRSYEIYIDLLNQGMAREAARAVLPQNLMTHFYMSGNLRNWIHFLGLRLTPHAQYESRIIAQLVRDILLEKWPRSGKMLLQVALGEKYTLKDPISEVVLYEDLTAQDAIKLSSEIYHNTGAYVIVE